MKVHLIDRETEQTLGEYDLMMLPRVGEGIKIFQNDKIYYVQSVLHYVAPNEDYHSVTLYLGSEPPISLNVKKEE